MAAAGSIIIMGCGSSGGVSRNRLPVAVAAAPAPSASGQFEPYSWIGVNSM